MDHDITVFLEILKGVTMTATHQSRTQATHLSDELLT